MVCPREANLSIVPNVVLTSFERSMRMLQSIMEPRCKECSDTGMIAGVSFDSDDPKTHEDWRYCLCERGLSHMREDNKLEEDMEDSHVDR